MKVLSKLFKGTAGKAAGLIAATTAVSTAAEQLVKAYKQVNEATDGALSGSLSKRPGVSFDRALVELNDVNQALINERLQKADRGEFAEFSRRDIVSILGAIGADEQREPLMAQFARASEETALEMLRNLRSRSSPREAAQKVKEKAKAAGSKTKKVGKAVGKKAGNAAREWQRRDQEDGNRLRQPGGWLERTREAHERAKRETDEKIRRARQ